jgi:hypothetical protein
MKRLGLVLFSAAVLMLPALPAAAAGGWVVRVCRGFTEADKIEIKVGATSNNPQLLANWKSDDVATDFPVPKPLKQSKTLYVHADSEPADGLVAMCVLYRGKPAQAMNFKDLQDVTVKRDAKDDACKCPKSGGQ